MAADNIDYGPYWRRLLKTLGSNRTIRLLGNQLYLPTKRAMAGGFDIRNPRQAITNLREALASLRASGTREYYKHAPIPDGKEGFKLSPSRPMSGYYSQNYLEDLSLHWAKFKKEVKSTGASVDLISFSQGIGNKEVHNIIAGGSGLAVERDTTKVLQLWSIENGKKVSAKTGELIKFLESHGTRFRTEKGFIPNFGTLSKRLGGLFSPQGLSTFTPDSLIKTAVYDPHKAFDYGRRKSILPRTLQGARDMEVANDAAIQVSSKFVHDQANKLELQAAKYMNEGRIDEAASMLEKIADLRKMATSGKGSYYAQIYGLDLQGVPGFDVSELTAGLNKGEGYSTKGLITINDKLTGRYNVDIVMAATNVKQELMTTFSKVNLDARKASHTVFIDAQTLTSHPRLFNVHDITQFNMKSAEDFITDLRAGNVPVKILDAVQRQIQKDMDKGVLSIEGFTDLEESKDFLRQISTLVRTGSTPANLPAFAKQLVNQYAKHISSKGLEVPDATRAYMIADILNERKGSTYNVAVGQAIFDDRNGRWVFNHSEFGKIAAILGGGDSDDAINMLLRWDETAKMMKGIATRNPNALGELYVFNIEDNAIYHALLHKDPQKAKDFMKRYNAKAMRRLPESQKVARQAERDLFLQENFAHIDDSSSLFQLAADYVESGTFGVTGEVTRTGKYITRIGGDYGKIVSFMDVDVSEEALNLEDKIAYARRYADDAIKSMQLGTHQNMTMVLGGFLDSLSKEHIDFLAQLKAAGEFGGFGILPEETLIDLLTKGGVLKGVADLETHVASVYEALGYANARLLQQFGDSFRGLDPTLLDKRGPFGRAAIAQGMRRAGGGFRLGDAEMDPSDPRAFFSHFDKAKDELAGFIRNLAADELYPDIRYPKEITEFMLGKDANKYTAEAKRLMGNWIGRIKDIDPSKTPEELLELREAGRELGSSSDIVGMAKWEMINAATESEIAGFSDDVAEQNKLIIAMVQEMEKNASDNSAYGAMLYGDKRTYLYARAHAYAKLEAARNAGEVVEGTDLEAKAMLDIPLEKIPSEIAAKVSGETVSEEAPYVRRAYQNVINRGEIAKMWEKPLFRRGTYALAGLMALGVARTILHRTPTPEQMGGSDYVPGGNAYDSYASQNMYGGQSSGTDFNSGVRYTINTRGDFERSNVQSQMMGIDSTFDFSGGRTYSLPSVGNEDKERNRLMSQY